jgi:autophagy-related protein 2
LRIRLHDTSLNILLYDGYDWVKTRKAIEDEIKTVRRKLERIRQLLASGQQADESIEQTRSVLFNSVYIGLDESKSGPIGLGMSMALGRAGEMNNADLLAAIDEELDEMGNDTASQSSWQTDFPNAQRPPNPTRSSTSTVAGKKGTRLRGKRLTRSKKPQIEISLQDIRTSVDLYDAEDPTASRLHAQVKSLEILDHIKTSTWKKFLTDLKGDGRGNVRETDADMVRIELSSVRPNLPHTEEEKRLKAKILPLRLHVDQDALDFLKRFFSFKAPTAAQVVVPAKTTSSPEPFFREWGGYHGDR